MSGVTAMATFGRHASHMLWVSDVGYNKDGEEIAYEWAEIGVFGKEKHIIELVDPDIQKEKRANPQFLVEGVHDSHEDTATDSQTTSKRQEA